MNRITVSRRDESKEIRKCFLHVSVSHERTASEIKNEFNQAFACRKAAIIFSQFPDLNKNKFPFSSRRARETEYEHAEVVCLLSSCAFLHSALVFNYLAGCSHEWWMKESERLNSMEGWKRDGGGVCRDKRRAMLLLGGKL
jgi:hypothetical protein